MSWLIRGNRSIAIGPRAAEAMATVVTRLKERIDIDGLDLGEALDWLGDNNQDDQWITSLVNLLKDRAADRDWGVLSRLLSTLGDLERQSSQKQRTFGWAGKNWTPELTSVPEPLDSLIIDLAAEGTLAFIVDPDDGGEDPGLPPLDGQQATARLRIAGRVSGRVSQDFDFSPAAARVDGDAGISRALTYHYAYHALDTRVGLAVATALRNLERPSDFNDVLASFHRIGPGTLRAIRLEGESGLGGRSRIAVTLPGPSGGTVGITLNGRVNWSKAFQVTLSSQEKGVVDAIVNFGRTRDYATEVSPGYTVGLSSLSPGGARKILARVSTMSGFLEWLDSRNGAVNEVSSWLKPGTLIGGQIEKAVKELISENGEDSPTVELARKGLARLFNLDAGEGFDAELSDKIVAETTALLMESVDDSLGVLLADYSELEQRLKREIEHRVGSRVRELVQAKLLDTLPELDKLLRKKAEQLDKRANKPLEELTGMNRDEIEAFIRRQVENARELLQRVLEGIESSVDEILGIEFAFERERVRRRGHDCRVAFTAEGAHSFGRAIADPAAFGQYLLEREGEPGVTVESLMHNTLLGRSNRSRYGISLASIEFKGGTSVSSEVEIIRTPEGMAAVSKGEVKKWRRRFGERRELSFITAFGAAQARKLAYDSGVELGGDGEEISPDTLSTTPRLALNFTETDESLKAGELETMLGVLVEEALISESTRIDVLRSFAEMAGEGASLEAVLSVSIAVPPARMAELIRYGAGNRDALRAIMRRLYATILEHEVTFAVRQVARGGIEIKDDDPETVLDNIESLIEQIRKQLRKQRPGSRRYGSIAGIAPDEVVEELVNIHHNLDVLHRVFSIANEILAKEENALNEEELEDRQEAILAHIKPFLSPAVAARGLNVFRVGNKFPLRNALIFKALQETAGQALGVAPPVIVQLTPENGRTKTFKSPVIDR